MENLKDVILSIIFPDTCIGCGKAVAKSEFICSRCDGKIDYINTAFKCSTCLRQLSDNKNKICGYCLSQKLHYSRLISCLKYEGSARRMLKMYKFHNRPDLHLGFSKLACEKLEYDGIFFDAVVPVPISKNTFLERGYNQSALVAKRIAQYFDVPYYEDLLVKIKETEKQSELSYKERKRNVKGAFDIHNPERINNSTILLVDDIFTTGFTMEENAKMCSSYCDEIIAFTIARGYLDK